MLNLPPFSPNPTPKKDSESPATTVEFASPCDLRLPKDAKLHMCANESDKYVMSVILQPCRTG